MKLTHARGAGLGQFRTRDFSLTRLLGDKLTHPSGRAFVSFGVRDANLLFFKELKVAMNQR
jgi:hypothetical protein